VFVLGQVHDFCAFFSAMTMTKRAFIAGVAALFLATGAAHAVDFCEDDGGCIDVKGRTCYKLSNCCKNPHDWATEGRDKTVCTVRQMRSYMRSRAREARKTKKICEREGKAAKTPEEKARYEECLKTGPCGVYIECE
jgi:hypothetical protein